MARLGNAKHEQFAQLVASGTPQGQAYVQAGYKASAPHASHLAKRPDVAKRIAELQAKSLAPVIGDQVSIEDEFSVGWIQMQYELICTKAREQGDMKTANAAIKNVESLIQFENKRLERDADKPTGAGRIDINTLGNVLDRVAGVIAASKAPEATTAYVEMKALRAAENEV